MQRKERDYNQLQTIYSLFVKYWNMFYSYFLRFQCDIARDVTYHTFNKESFYIWKKMRCNDIPVYSSHETWDQKLRSICHLKLVHKEGRQFLPLICATAYNICQNVRYFNISNLYSQPIQNLEKYHVKQWCSTNWLLI